MCLRLGLGCRHRHVRRDAGTFPVALGGRGPDLPVRHSDLEVVTGRVCPPRVCRAGGLLADDHGPTFLLEDEGAPFSSGERARGGQHVDRTRAVPEIDSLYGGRVQLTVSRPGHDLEERLTRDIEQIGREQRHGIGCAAAVLPHVHDECVGPGQQAHGSGESVARFVGPVERGQVQVPDVAGENRRLADTEVLAAAAYVARF